MMYMYTFSLGSFVVCIINLSNRQLATAVKLTTHDLYINLASWPSHWYALQKIIKLSIQIIEMDQYEPFSSIDKLN